MPRGRYWTDDERKFIIESFKAGNTHSETARQIGGSVNGVADVVRAYRRGTIDSKGSKTGRCSNVRIKSIHKLISLGLHKVILCMPDGEFQSKDLKHRPATCGGMVRLSSEGIVRKVRHGDRGPVWKRGNQYDAIRAGIEAVLKDGCEKNHGK